MAPLAVGILVAASLLQACPATAQESRQAAAAERRIARSRETREVDVPRLEQWLLKINDDRVMERLFNPRHGFFVRVGLPAEASGLGAGPAWRLGDQRGRYHFTVSAAASASRNWVGEVALRLPDVLPGMASDRVFADVSVSRLSRSSIDFWGVGQRSSQTARTGFTMAQSSTLGTLGFRLHEVLSVGARAEWLESRVGRSTERHLPFIDELFDDRTAAGLARQPTFGRSGAFLDLDYSDSIPPTRTARRLDRLPLAGASRGGRYQVAVDSLRDRDFGQYSFRRTTIDLRQYAPFLHGHRVVTVRALAVLTHTRPGQRVPFYLMPALGGSAVGRGDRFFRFRDEQLLALQAEYRYVINPLMSGAVFVDAGQVAPRVRDFGWSRFRTSYGLGLRVGARGAAALRLDLAFGGDDPRLLIGMGHAF